jgi:hypothetical protein
MSHSAPLQQVSFKVGHLKIAHTLRFTLAESISTSLSESSFNCHVVTDDLEKDDVIKNKF